MNVKALKFTKNHRFHGISRIWAFFHGRRPIPRKMSRPWSRELGWSLHIIQVAVLSQRGRAMLSVCLISFSCTLQCVPTASVSGRQHLRSARRGQLEMHRFRLSSLGGRSFFCAAPSLWNTLPVTVTDSSLSLHSFLGHLKTFFFSLYPPAHRAR